MAIFAHKQSGSPTRTSSGPRMAGSVAESDSVIRAGKQNGNAHIGRGQVSELQRVRLIAAMTEVAAELGVANATVAHVVARAGVSRRTFYELFEDREQCFLAALDSAIARAAERVLAAYDPDTRWHERLRGALVGLLAFLEDNSRAGRVLIVESLGAGPAALECRERVLAYAISAVDEGRDETKNGPGPPLVTAEGAVGGVLSVLHSRLCGTERGGLLELTSPLMGMVVLPYLGVAAARRETERPVPIHAARPAPGPADPLRGTGMRLTYRTARVLAAVAERPGSSNRELGIASEMQDQGQISKLLSRLSRLGLIENTGVGPNKGAPNAWVLTEKGRGIQEAIVPRSASY
jgi:AcrR family transcriptional regulator